MAPSRICLILATFWLKISVAMSYGCSKQAPQKAMRCIETLFPTAQQSGPTGYALVWDYSKMKAACIDGTISLSVFCVRSIMDQCEDDPEQLALLAKYVDTERMQAGLHDTERMQAGLHTLCQQLDEARKYMPCMQSQLQGFMQCAQDKLGVFEERSKVAGGDVDKLVAASCRRHVDAILSPLCNFSWTVPFITFFMNIVYGCQTTAVRIHCGGFPAKFILQIMNAFRPPSCHRNGAIGLLIPRDPGIKVCCFLLIVALLENTFIL